MIREVTDTLVSVIESNTRDLGTWVTPNGLESDGPSPAQNRLALSLYSIDEHDHARNRPLEFDGDAFRRPPMLIRLSYIMAYYGADGVGSHLDTQARLDRVAQVFHAAPILGATQLSPALLGIVDKLTVRMWSPTADERNQIWTALGRSMRLALYYVVDAVPIIPAEVEGSTPITEQQITFHGLAQPS